MDNWLFGKNNIFKIKQSLEEANIDILELGFMRDVPENPDCTLFSSMKQVDNLLGKKKKGTIYSTMIEAFNPYPLEKLCPASDTNVDLVRVCVWKRCLKEHFDYCKEIVKKGYKITIQPSRVEQYSEKEFVELLEMANELSPYAVYVVDTWGTQSKEDIIKYIRLCDSNLLSGIKVGYHGHNNKMQALSCAQAVLDLSLSREICLDSTLFGMGRGAGNLNTEIILQYLARRQPGQRYKCEHLPQIIDACISPFNVDKNIWGYSMYYFLCASYDCNPNYATLCQERSVPLFLFEELLKSMNEKEKIIYSESFVANRLKELGGSL